jgi:hypothetical protein
VVGKITGIEAVRARELGRLFDHRYGPQLPDDDAGIDDARLMLSQLVALPNAAERVGHFLDLRTPWLIGPEREREIEHAFRSGPGHFTADEVAQRLGVDLATRTALRLTTIGAIDRDAVKRKEDRRRRRAGADQERRARRSRAKAAANGAAGRGRPPRKSRIAQVRDTLLNDGLPPPLCHSPASSSCCWPLFKKGDVRVSGCLPRASSHEIFLRPRRAPAAAAGLAALPAAVDGADRSPRWLVPNAAEIRR